MGKYSGKQLIAALLAALLVSGCQAGGNGATTSSLILEPQGESSSTASDADIPQEQETRQEEEKPPSVRGEMAKLGPEEGNWIGLTKEQMKEDADYLHQILRENFPYFHVIQRMTGVDLEKEYEACLAEIEAAETDMQFYLALDHWIEKAGGLGHLTLFRPGMYPFMVEIYKDYPEEREKGDMDRKKLYETYADEKAVSGYEAMGKLLEPLFEKVDAYYAQQEEAPGETEPEEQGWKTVETKILEPGKIAYIAVNSLDMESYEEDKKVLFDFYGQVKDYDHVIFDFTQNGGGGMGYFNDLIAAPNTDKPLQANVYQFLMGGDYNRSFFDFTELKPISELPDLPRLPDDDRASFAAYADEPYVIEPSGEGKLLNGKLWLLVSENVFSSSEYAAMLCKQTGFMTLVGTTTGGDGIGADPLPVVLPNSGLAVRYSSVYGTAADGTGSQEFGTEPDIASPEGESALDTCLKAIAELEEKGA